MNFSKIICSICAITSLVHIGGYAGSSSNDNRTSAMEADTVWKDNLDSKATTSINPSGNTVKTLANTTTGGSTVLTLTPDGSHMSAIRIHGGLFVGFSTLATIKPEGGWMAYLTTQSDELKGTLVPESIGENGTVYNYIATNIKNASSNFHIVLHADGGAVITNLQTKVAAAYTPTEVKRMLSTVELSGGSDTMKPAVALLCLGKFLESTSN